VAAFVPTFPKGKRSVTGADAERVLPPAVRAAVEILRERGHVVTVRLTDMGSRWYSVDGARETNAEGMSRRFRHLGL
jgi:hypothetical protein